MVDRKPKVQRAPKIEIDWGTPAVDLTKRLIDMTGAELVEILDARIAFFLDAAPKPREDAMLDRAGVAKFLDLSTTQVDKLAREHGLPFHRVGDVKRFDRDEVRAWVKARASGDTPQKKGPADGT